MSWSIAQSLSEFQTATRDWSDVVAADVETHGNAWNPDSRRLLGVSFSPESPIDVAVYVPFYVFEDGALKDVRKPELLVGLAEWLKDKRLVGHNFSYDWRWLREHEFETSWHACTRLMWHLADNPAGHKGYSLKDGQRQILGWKDSNDKKLGEHIKAQGGKWTSKQKDFYMAELGVMAEYACDDTRSTIALYRHFKPFFEKYDYWHMLHQMMDYNLIIERNTFYGVPVDVEGLQEALTEAEKQRDKLKKKLDKQLGPHIKEMEAAWLEEKILSYKPGAHKEYHVKRLMANPDKWPKFNWNSDAHKRELFYLKLGQPVLYKTDGGQPSVNKDAIKAMQGSWRDPYLEYNKYEYLINNFINPWLESVEDGVLHPGFNVCGTVSYRLSGFKPYFLNLPFGELWLMKNFKVPEGWAGVHADLAAIEPTVTAHFSEDPNLLKVFRDGLGDIYLDLALEIFKDDEKLHTLYDPNKPVTNKVKEALSHVRKPSKITQLAVQYTGTGHTVSLNLTKAGLPTDVETAKSYVRAYWRKFRRVSEWEYQLREVNRRLGYLRNIIGRIIRVPDPEYKDLMNRFVQSSAHDCLSLWVLIIDRMVKERKIEARPVLADCHDSTSWIVRVDQKHLLRQVYDDALAEVNETLQLGVTIRAETQFFKTFAGLKAEEE